LTKNVKATEVPLMTTIHKLATIGTAALVALTLAAPASAKQAPRHEFTRVAAIDCGDGPVKVGSTNALWAPLVDLRTGEKYKPVAFSVSGEGFSVDVSKRNVGQDAATCSYDDGEAAGTVTVR
jgi:hypothetical protein